MQAAHVAPFANDKAHTMKTTHTLDMEIAQTEERLAALRAIRTAEIRDAHTFTAADYRITIEDERYAAFDLEDIMGEIASESDAPSVFEWQRKLTEALADERNETHGGVWCYVVTVSERNPETGEYEMVDGCSGVYHLGCDGREALLSHAREIAADFLPDGIKTRDVEIVTE